MAKNFIKNKKLKRPKFNGSPQRKGVVLRLRIVTPKKPNSARRPIAKVMLSTRKKALSHIPGTSQTGNASHSLRRHSRTLVKGQGARDLPVVNYTCIRGVYDLVGVYGKKKRRSIYGIKLPADLKTHVRRNIRHLV